MSDNRLTISRDYCDGVGDGLRYAYGGTDQYYPSQWENAIKGLKKTLQAKTATPGASQQVIEPDSGYDGLTAVTVSGDADLVAGNIKKDVEIFGVTGTYEGGGGGGDDPFALTDYIQSSGTQYIDTGYLVQPDTVIEMVANITNTSGSPIFFGSRNSSTSKNFWIGKSGGQNVIQDGNGGGTINYSSGSLSQKLGIKTVARKAQYGSCFTTNGVIAEGPAYSASSFTANYSIALFALNSAGTVSLYTTMKLYRFRIYEGTTLVHEFVPWTDSNDVVCLKDTVTGNLKYNAGTGVFTRGTDT